MMTETYGPHLIDFYELPPRAPGDLSTRMIGRLTAAGMVARDTLPTYMGGYGIYKTSPADGCIRRIDEALAPLQARQLIAELSRCAGHGSACTGGALWTRVYDDAGGGLAPEWHREDIPTRRDKRRFIIGNSNPAANTEYATVPLTYQQLGYELIPQLDDERDCALTAFLTNLDAIGRIGADEVAEQFNDTPHRTSPIKVGLRRFTCCDFD